MFKGMSGVQIREELFADPDFNQIIESFGTSDLPDPVEFFNLLRSKHSESQKVLIKILLESFPKLQSRFELYLENIDKLKETVRSAFLKSLVKKVLDAEYYQDNQPGRNISNLYFNFNGKQYLIKLINYSSPAFLENITFDEVSKNLDVRLGELNSEASKQDMDNLGIFINQLEGRWICNDYGNYQTEFEFQHFMQRFFSEIDFEFEDRQAGKKLTKAEERKKHQEEFRIRRNKVLHALQSLLKPNGNEQIFNTFHITTSNESKVSIETPHYIYIYFNYGSKYFELTINLNSFDEEVVITQRDIPFDEQRKRITNSRIIDDYEREIICRLDSILKFINEINYRMQEINQVNHLHLKPEEFLEFFGVHKDISIYRFMQDLFVPPLNVFFKITMQPSQSETSCVFSFTFHQTNYVFCIDNDEIEIIATNNLQKVFSKIGMEQKIIEM